jgi:hypothetical protein
MEPKPGTRAKSEKRQTTREKKQLVKSLCSFLTKYDNRDFTNEEGANQLEEMIEKLKICFLYTDGGVLEQKELFDVLEEWIGLERSESITNLLTGEIKEEMKLEYLVGLQDVAEVATPEADEPEEFELEISEIEKASSKEVLDTETAMQLAGTIKAAAVKLFGNGKILGGLGVQLDEASDSIFRLLRKQREAAAQKEYLEKAKAEKKAVATADPQGNKEQASAAVAGQVARDTTVDMDNVDLSDLGEIPTTTV